MPAYGYLQWGDCGTIINPQQTVDYLTKMGPQSDFPLQITNLVDPCMAAYRRPDGQLKQFVSPDIDPAPWYSPYMGDDVLTNPSAQFLGVIISEVEGLDSTATREVTQRLVGSGGGSMGPSHATHRALKFSATLYATSCRGMTYGMSWLTQTLRGRSACSNSSDLCTMELWTGCPDIVSTRIDPQDSRWQFRDVALTEGPKYSSAPINSSGHSETSCYIREVTWTLVSEQPYIYKCPFDTLPQTATSVPMSGNIPILQWLSSRNQVTLTANPSSGVGEDAMVVEMTAGSRPMDAVLTGNVNPFAVQGCRAVNPPELKVNNGLNMWKYQVASNGSWNRYDTDASGQISGAATPGTGPIRGTTDVNDPTTFRDIEVSFTSVAPGSAPASGAMLIEAFHDLKIIGGQIDVSYTPGGSPINTNRALSIRNWNGFAYIEGLLITGNTLQQGIEVGSKYKDADLRIRNCRVEKVLVNGAAVDVVDNLFGLYVDNFTGADLTGHGVRIVPAHAYGSLGDNLVQEVMLHNVNIQSSTTPHPGIRVNAATAAARHIGVRLQNVYINIPASVAPVRIEHSSGGAEPTLVSGVDTYGRGYVTLNNNPAWGLYGQAFVQLSPDTDFVPNSAVGSAYSFFNPADGAVCASYNINNLPPGYTLRIDSANETITAKDLSGAWIDGSPYVTTPGNTAYQWMVFDCDPICIRYEQLTAFAGDGGTIKIQQVHREML